MLAVGLDRVGARRWHAVAIAGSLDDHSRYLVGLRADADDADGDLVWSVIVAGIDRVWDTVDVVVGQWNRLHRSIPRA